MPRYTEEIISASIHDFKSNISKYIRMLERGDYKAVVVRQYNERVGVFLTNNSTARFEARQKARMEAEGIEGN